MSLEFGVRGTAVRASMFAGYIPWRKVEQAQMAKKRYITHRSKAEKKPRSLPTLVFA